MIISMRRFLKNNAKEGVGVIVTAALLIGLVGLPTAFQKSSSDVWAVRVNGDSIDYKNFIREVFQYREFIAALKSSYGQFANYILASMGMNTDPEQIAIDKLIHQTLVDQIARKIGVSMHADYVDEKTKDQTFMKNLFSSSVFKADGTIDMELMRRELMQRGLTVAEFEEQLLQGISRDFTLNLLKKISYIPQFDTNFTYQSRNAAHDVLVFELPYEQFLKRAHEREISDAEAREYFLTRNRAERKYWSDETRNGALYRFQKSSYEVSISENDLQSYYEQNKIKKYVKTPARITVQKITDADAKKNFPEKEFQNIVFNISDSQYDSLWVSVKEFSRGTHEEVFERAAFSLKNPGDVSGIINLSDGSRVVLKLVQSTPRVYKSFDSVRDSIKKELELQQFKVQFVRDMNEAIKTGEISAILDQKDVQKTPLQLVTAEGSSLGTTQLFGIKKIGDYAVFIEKDSGYVVQLVSIEPSVEQDFSEVRQLVLDDMYADAAHESLKNVLLAINSNIATDGFDSFFKKYSGKTLFDGIIHPADESEIKKVEKYGLYSELLGVLHRPHMVYVLDEERGIIVYVREVTYQEDKQPDRKEVEKNVEGRVGQYTSSIVASFYRDAKIDINELILGNFPEESL